MTTAPLGADPDPGPALAVRGAPRSLADLAGRHVAVWSYGVEGRAAVAALQASAAPPASITVVDERDGLDAGDLPSDVALVRGGDAGAAALAAADVVVASPGMARYRPEHVAARGRGALTTGTGLLLASPLGRRTLAITGSKGKSTTTKLAHHLLAGLAPSERVTIGGNLGRAPVEVLVAEPSPDRVVLEVSSFQAAEVADPPAVGIVTALFPDHLDWHGDLERYVADKCNLFARGTTTGVVAVDAASPLLARAVADGLVPGATPFGTPDGWHVDEGGVVRRGRAGAAVLAIEASPLVGEHNARNLCGVLTALEAWGLDPIGRAGEVEALLRAFRPLPHRLEVAGSVAVPGGFVTAVDDGMSTNPDAAIAAAAAFGTRPLTLLLGGADRGVPFEGLGAALARRADEAPTVAVVVPACGGRMAAAIRAAGTDIAVVEAVDLAEAVAEGLRRTPPGGVLCLSPGAPSFTEFPSGYKARSARFRQLLGLPAALPEL